MRHSLVQQRAKAFKGVHKALIFSVVWVSQACCGLKGHSSKPLLRYCTAFEPSKPCTPLPSSTDNNTALGGLKPSGDVSKHHQLLLQLLLWQRVEMASDTYRDIYQALGIKQIDLATLKAECWISHTHTSSGWNQSTSE